eukprot:scaffold1237_cov243-Pinguiococcus_pyrenoidosus.AAC.16
MVLQIEKRLAKEAGEETPNDEKVDASKQAGTKVQEREKEPSPERAEGKEKKAKAHRVSDDHFAVSIPWWMRTLAPLASTQDYEDASHATGQLARWAGPHVTSSNRWNFISPRHQLMEYLRNQGRAASSLGCNRRRSTSPALHRPSGASVEDSATLAAKNGVAKGGAAKRGTAKQEGSGVEEMDESSRSSNGSEADDSDSSMAMSADESAEEAADDSDEGRDAVLRGRMPEQDLRVAKPEQDLDGEDEDEDEIQPRRLFA